MYDNMYMYMYLCNMVAILIIPRSEVSLYMYMYTINMHVLYPYAYRYAPDINKRANVRRMFPGLGLGIMAFLVLSTWEEFYYKPRHPEEYSTGHH